MRVLQLRLSFLLVLIAAVHCQTVSVGDLKEKIRESLNEKENIKNVVKVLGLDLSNFGEGNTNEQLCSLIKASNPELVGLQEVKIPQLIELKQCFTKIKTCSVSKIKTKSRNRRSRRTTRCSHYEIIGAGSINSEETTFFNPIIFKRERGLRSLGPNGTFWLSETPDRPFSKLDGAAGRGICTWAKLRFAVREGSPKKPHDIGNAFFETLYTVLKTTLKKEKRTTKWVDFYFANTRFDENVEVATQQFEIFYDYLRMKVMAESTNIPIILATGSNPEVASKIAEILTSRSLNNAITDSRQMYNDKLSSTRSTTFISQSGFVNLVSMKSFEELESQYAAILFQ